MGINDFTDEQLKELKNPYEKHLDKQKSLKSYFRMTIKMECHQLKYLKNTHLIPMH